MKNDKFQLKTAVRDRGIVFSKASFGRNFGGIIDLFVELVAIRFLNCHWFYRHILKENNGQRVSLLVCL
jgi:hypothetical protein